MAGSTQIILIIACAAILADCRLRGKFNQQQKKNQDVYSNTVVEQKVLDEIKTSDTNLVVSGVEKSRDSDVIVFPSDDDFRIYPDVNNTVSETLSTTDINKVIDVARITTDTPLLPKVVPAIEAKEVFTNPTPKEEFTLKTIDITVEENIKTSPKPIKDFEKAKAAIEANANQGHGNISELENISNDKSNANETAPDFSNRFGESGNYMLVPVNNVPTYQPIQTYQQGNTQNGIYDQGNIINPNTNICDDSQYIPQNSNILQNGAYNANNNGNPIPQGTNNVPITVSNTYMINGQLYAALTVPNNMNVPNSIYLINPQLPHTGYQVANNLPVYKVQGDQGSYTIYLNTSHSA